MARTTISLPDKLKKRMAKVEDQVNWSSTAAEAFYEKLEQLESPAASTPHATIDIAGDELDSINILKTYMAEQLPGVSFKPADIVRYALHLAADTVAAIKESETIYDNEKQTD